jgi:uncharacterized protein
MHLMTEDVEFSSLDGVAIRGTHMRVQDPQAVCLFLHGITTDRNEHLDLHKRLAISLIDSQVSSLLIDFRAHGKSDGRQIDFSPIGQSLDCVAAVNFLSANYNLAKVPLTIVGTSFGAGPSIIAARRLGSVIRQMFFIAPVLDYAKTFLQPNTEWAKNSFSKKALAEIDTRGFLLLDGSFQVGARLIYELGVINLTSEARSLEQPILILHGVQDSMVSIATSIEFVSQNHKARLIQIKDMDHGFAAPDDEKGTRAASQRNLSTIKGELADFVRKSISAQ